MTSYQTKLSYINERKKCKTINLPQRKGESVGLLLSTAVKWKRSKFVNFFLAFFSLEQRNYDIIKRVINKTNNKVKAMKMHAYLPTTHVKIFI